MNQHDSATRSAPRFLFLFFGFAFTILSVSVRFFKQFGIWGMLGYVLLGTAAIYLIVRHGSQRVVQRITTRQAHVLALVIAITVAILGVILHGLINRNALHIPGFSYGNTDIDDALIDGLNALLRGQYPYSVRTWAGGELTPMPGALMLALPFHLLGDIVIQNAFWLYMLFLALAYLAKDSRYAMVLWAAALVLSPKIFEEEVAQGSDRLVNATYVALATLLLIELAKRKAGRGYLVLAGLVCGVAFSSRMNFLLLIPILMSALIRSSGWRQGIALTGTVALGFAAVTAPFYLTSEGSFSPLHNLGKLSHATPWLTGIGWLTPVAAALLALWLAFRSDNASTGIFLRNCFLVQLVLVVIETLLTLPSNNSVLTWMYVQYGYFYLPFGVLYFGSKLCHLLQSGNPKAA